MGVQEHDLAAACAKLNMMARHARPADLAGAVDAIRAMAQTEGRLPVVAVARAIEAALARGERGVAVQRLDRDARRSGRLRAQRRRLHQHLSRRGRGAAGLLNDGFV